MKTFNEKTIDPVKLCFNLILVCWTLFVMLIASIGFIIFLLTK